MKQMSLRSGWITEQMIPIALGRNLNPEPRSPSSTALAALITGSPQTIEGGTSNKLLNQLLKSCVSSFLDTLLPLLAY